MKKKAPPTLKFMPERSLQAVRELDKALGGEGIEITIGSPENRSVRGYFSNRLRPLRVKTINAAREIEVEVSSIEHENNELLHYLVRKTREG